MILSCVCIFHAYHEHACLDEQVCCYLDITDVQQLCPFSLPFKSIFLILHVTPLSCSLLNTMLIRCNSKCQILDCLKIIELDVE